MASGQKPPGQRKQRSPHRYWKPAIRPHWTEIVLAVALLVVGIAQVVIYLRQTNIMKTQAGISVDANRLSAAIQRAFVVSAGLDIAWTYDQRIKRNAWVGQPIWENTGNTATTDLKLWMNYCPRTTPLPDTFSYPDLATGITHNTVLAPHQSKKGPIPYFIGPEIMPFVQAHTAMFYIYGWGLYTDELEPKKLHETDFCYVINDFMGNPFDGSGKPVVLECDRYHCVDDQCRNKPIPRVEDRSLCGVTFATMPTVQVPPAPAPPKPNVERPKAKPRR